MTSELLYTSAPKGLRQGSRGFCTVISSAGMPSNLATKLESLSGYRQMFAPESPEASQNPVTYSHLTCTIGGQSTSVLSRIAAYGTDYSGRTNKLAHHVVPDRTELVSAGPAWLLQQSGFMRTQWDGACQTTPAGPTISSADIAAALCRTWQALAGDAGWAGVLAEAWSQRQGKPIWIVYSLEHQTQLLQLLSEATALLPEHERWKATFSTYATQLPPDVQCRVRCVVDNTQDARMAMARGTVIKLGQPNGTPPASNWAEVARGTRVISPTPQVPTPQVPTPQVPTPEVPASQVPAPQVPGTPLNPTTQVPAIPSANSSPAGYIPTTEQPPALRPPVTVSPAGLTVIPGPNVINGLPDGLYATHQPAKTKGGKRLSWVVAVAVAVLLLGGGAFYLYKNPDVLGSKTASKSATQNDSDPSSTATTTPDSNEPATQPSETKNDPNDTRNETEKPAMVRTLAIMLREDLVEEGSDVTVDITRGGYKKGEKIFLDIPDEEHKNRFVKFDHEVKFDEDKNEKTITLKLYDNDVFDPTSLTLVVNDDGDVKDEAKLYIKDNDLKPKHLTIGELDDNERNEDSVRIQEGGTYKFALKEEQEQGKFNVSISKPKDQKDPSLPTEMDIDKIYTTSGKTLKVLETNDHYFKKDHLKLAVHVSVALDGKTVAECDVRCVIDDDDPATFDLKWDKPANPESDDPKTATHPNDKSELPSFKITSNIHPPPTIKLVAKSTPEDAFTVPDKTEPNHIVKLETKTPPKHNDKSSVTIEASYEKLTQKELTLNLTKPPPKTYEKQDLVAKVSTIKAMTQTTNGTNQKIQAYDLINLDEWKPSTSSTFKFFIEKNDKTTELIKGPKNTSIETDLKSLFKIDGTPQHYSGTNTPVKVIVYPGKFAIQLTLDKKLSEDFKLDNDLKSLYGKKSILEDLMSTASPTIAGKMWSQPDLPEKFKATNNRGSIVEKNTITSIRTALEGGIPFQNPQAPWFLGDNVKHTLTTAQLSKGRKTYFSDYLSSGKTLDWEKLNSDKDKLSHDKLLDQILNQPNGLKLPRNKYLKKDKSGKIIERRDNDSFILVTEHQIKALKAQCTEAADAIKRIEKMAPLKTGMTLIIKRDGQEVLTQPLDFKLTFE